MLINRCLINVRKKDCFGGPFFLSYLVVENWISEKATSLPFTIKGDFFNLTVHGFWNNVEVRGPKYKDTWLNEGEDNKENIVHLIDIDIQSKIHNDYWIDSSEKPIRVLDNEGYSLSMLSSLECSLPHKFDWLDNGMSKVHAMARQRGFISYKESKSPIGKIILLTDSDDSDYDQFLEIDLSDIAPSDKAKIEKLNTPKQNLQTLSGFKFDKDSIENILKVAINDRFRNFTPYDFEDFIGELYKKRGYDVEGTNYSGDFGADVIVLKDDIKTVIQVKRYHENNTVGVKDINQVLGAKSYYNADKATVITTSDFSKPGIELSERTNVELISWDALVDMIEDTFYLDDILKN